MAVLSYIPFSAIKDTLMLVRHSVSALLSVLLATIVAKSPWDT